MGETTMAAPKTTPMENDRLERCARKLCELRGIDPDLMVDAPARESRTMVLMRKPAWELAAAEIQDQINIQAAMKVK